MDAVDLVDSVGWTRSSALTWSRLAPNPGPMTLDGTNSYIISAPGFAGVVVVDPGPVDEPHLRALAGRGMVELVLITHWHRDHTAGSRRFRDLTGAPVRALAAAYCLGGQPLQPGERITAAGVRIEVIATPGHTADSVCFWLPDDGPTGSVLTGDTILGRGSTVIDYPDGRLGAYLRSLETLERMGPARLLPAHGPVLPDLAAASGAYLAHRNERLVQVRAALEQLGPQASAAGVAAVVYADTPVEVRAAAELSVAAQLEFLRGGSTAVRGARADDVK
ncbi:MBL fold metallo-hydrolase [Arthrobacter sp. A5]|uniref:MBL fold metallo-hydrolase n=1 Tax=Arthrobacter sp. A5 TaxID=576926 RepID=UPI003DA993DE